MLMLELFNENGNPGYSKNRLFVPLCGRGGGGWGRAGGGEVEVENEVNSGYIAFNISTRYPNGCFQ